METRSRVVHISDVYASFSAMLNGRNEFSSRDVYPAEISIYLQTLDQNNFHQRLRIFGIQFPCIVYVEHTFNRTFVVVSKRL